jgi:ATP synthase protein I
LALNSSYRAFASYGSVGIELVLSIVVGLFGGRWLDERLGTGGILGVVGLVVGVVAGFRAVWRAAKRAEREAESQDQEPPSPRDPEP